jgi:hypothetical protein
MPARKRSKNYRVKFDRFPFLHKAFKGATLYHLLTNYLYRIKTTAT